MQSTKLNSNGIWSSAYYNGVMIAHGLASIARHQLDGNGAVLKRTFVGQYGETSPLAFKGIPLSDNCVQFGEEDVKPAYLRASTSDPADTDLGKADYYDIVVEGAPPLKDAAWQYTDPPEQHRAYKNCFAFKVKYRPDHIGNGVFEMNREEGVLMFEDWAL